MPKALLKTPAALQTVCDNILASGSVALDTEFVWERTYHPRLGLVQIALPDESIHLVDAVALPHLDGLGDVLQAPHVRLLLHDALQDLQILARHTRSIPSNVFDTRRAAGFAGLSCTTSLANLLADLLQIPLDKESTRSNWLQRPLSDKQLDYACADVRYLHQAADLLEARIQARGHTEAFREEMQMFENPEIYKPATTATLFSRFRTSRMSHEARARLYQLLQWREQEARRANRPRRHILADDRLISLAHQGLHNTSAPPPNRSRHAPPPATVPPKYAAALRAFLIKAPTLQPADLPFQPAANHGRKTDSKNKIQARKAAMIQRANAAGIDPDLIANRAEITALVLQEAGLPTAPPPAHITHGWRQPFLAPPGNSTLPPR